MFIEIPFSKNNSRLPLKVMEKVIIIWLHPSPDSLNDLLPTSQWEEIKKIF